MVARGEDSLPLSEINSLVTPELPAAPLGSVTLCGEGTGDDEKDRRTLCIWGGCCDARLRTEPVCCLLLPLSLIHI